jgi:small subunit ribosomal protein S20
VVSPLGFTTRDTIYKKYAKIVKKHLLFGKIPAKIPFCTVENYYRVNLPKEVFGLPNIKSAKKRVLIGEMRNARNKAAKSELKTAIKKFEVAAAEGNRTEADGAYKVAVKKVDQAVAKGILHKNTAAHKKSALTLKLNKIG